MTGLTDECVAVVGCVCGQIRVARNMWERVGETAAISNIVRSGDRAICVDFLNAVVVRG